MRKQLTSGLKVLNSRFRLTSHVSTTQDCQTWIARDDDEAPFLLKAWPAGEKPDPVLRAVWDRELRVLYRASSSPGAEDYLLVVREAQFDREIGAFILLSEGPGYDSLVSQIQARASCEWLKIGSLKRREYRQPLWRGFKQVALAIHALHAQQIIHRNVSAESVFVDASDGPETMRLGSFEWSVRVGSTSHTGPDDSWSIPPEIADGTSGYTFDSDWYAFGMLLARTDPDTHLADVAMTLNNLGILHNVQNRMEEARKAYEEALGTYRQLARTNPDTYLPDVARTL